MSTRGFSLAEVLASLCVLSLLAAAVLPLVAECRRLDHPQSHDRILELSLAADAIVADASEYALDGLPLGEMRAIALPDGSTIEVERASFGGSHAIKADWLVFRAGGREVCRLVPYAAATR